MKRVMIDSLEATGHRGKVSEIIKTALKNKKAKKSFESGVKITAHLIKGKSFHVNVEEAGKTLLFDVPIHLCHVA